MEEEKVSLEIGTRTLKLIEKAKERLTNHPRFTWVKHLSIDEFMDFFFGLSEVSQYCRQTFVETVNKISENDLMAVAAVPVATHVAPATPSATSVKQVEKVELMGYLPSKQLEIIQALKGSNIPLTMRQLATVTKLPTKYVRHALSVLSKKSIIQRVPNTFAWRVNLEVAKGYGRKEIPIIEKLKRFLANQEEAMSTAEIARRVGANRKTMSQYLWDLHDKGLVERVPILPNKTLWKPTDALRTQ